MDTRQMKDSMKDTMDSARESMGGATESMRQTMRDQSRNVGNSERWLSLVGGAAAAAQGIRKGGLGGLLWTAAGAALLYRGASGHCPMYERMGRSTAHPGEQGLLSSVSRSGSQGAELHATISINREAGDLYTYWREFSRLPEFMRYIDEVRQVSDNRWHWRANMPVAGKIDWYSEVTEDIPNERIAWQSVPDSDIHTTGEVRFRRHPAGRATDVEVFMTYQPGGAVGSMAAKVGKGMSEHMLREDLRRFKQIMETGEIARAGATTEAMAQEQRPLQ